MLLPVFSTKMKKNQAFFETVLKKLALVGCHFFIMVLKMGRNSKKKKHPGLKIILIFMFMID